MIADMMKKEYIVPNIQIFELALTDIICESNVNISIGGNIDHIDAAHRRNNDWEEYLKK